MTPQHTLPRPLRRQLSALAGRVRVLQLIQGVSLLLLTSALILPAVFLADALYPLPQPLLSLALTCSLALLGGLLLVGLLWPLRRPIDYPALAAKVEEQHPELRERLTSALELTDSRTTAHGSAAFIALLLREAEEQTRSLVLTEAIPTRRARRRAAAAAVALLLAAVPAFLWADEYNAFAHRFLLAYVSPPDLQFRVTPGDGHAALGRPLSFDVRAERRDGRVPWPAEASLVLTDAAGTRKQVPLREQGEGRYTCRLGSVTGDFQYRVTAGWHRSPLYRIEAVRPVELAEHGLTISVTPPGYTGRESTTVSGTDADLPPVLQYSQVRLHCRFTTPAERATLTVADLGEPEGEKATLKSWKIPLTLGQGGTDAELLLPAFPPGRYRLALQLSAGHGIVTDCDPTTLTVDGDTPPYLTDAHGPHSRTVVAADAAPAVEPEPIAPDDALPLDVTAGDDVGVDRVELEYRVNGGPVQTELLHAANGATTTTIARHFPLGSKVKDGDLFLYRLRAADSRSVGAGSHASPDGGRVPTADLGPQTAYLPAPAPDGRGQWFALRVRPRTDPLWERDTLAEHDEIRKELRSLQLKLEKNRQDLFFLDRATRNRDDLPPELLAELAKLWQAGRDAKQELTDLADRLSANPELQPLGEEAQSLAGGELARADEHLRDARLRQDQPAPRQDSMDKADLEWVKAIDRLRKLQEAGDRLLQARLDRGRLEQLAAREQELGARAAALGANGDKNDPKTQERLRQLEAEQGQVGEQLERLAGSSEALRPAVRMAQAEQAGELAREADGLAAAQRELADQARAAQKRRLLGLLAEFARKQRALADEAGVLGRRTGPDAEARRIDRLDTRPADAAVDSLRHGQAQEALGLQDRSARELDRLADGLRDLPDWSQAPRGLLQDLAGMQKAVEDRLTRDAARVAQLQQRPQELMQAFREIVQGQDQVVQAAHRVAPPRAGGGAGELLSRVRDRAAEAGRLLRQFDTLDAHQAMQEARAGLEQLAGMAADFPAPPPPDTGPDPGRAEKVADLRDLARRQRDLRDELKALLARPAGGEPGPGDNPMSLPPGAQDDLAARAGKAAEAMNQLAGSAPDAAKAAMKQAEQAAGQAREAMKQAADADQRGDAGAAANARAAATTKLEQAAMKAKEAAAQLKKSAGGDAEQSAEGENPGGEFQRGRAQAEMARQSLEQGQPAAARAAMQQAAQALRQAARQMGPSGRGTGAPGQGAEPAASAAPPSGAPDLGRFTGGTGQYAGKTWNRLPGDLQAQIFREMRAQYGDEYAGVIRRYFERTADTDRPRRD